MNYLKSVYNTIYRLIATCIRKDGLVRGEQDNGKDKSNHSRQMVSWDIITIIHYRDSM